jgi:hypothetical protein
MKNVIEIKAEEAFGTPYMTQYSAEVQIEQRLYISRILGGAVSIGDWRGATAEEKETWEIEMLNILNYQEL